MRTLIFLFVTFISCTTTTNIVIKESKYQLIDPEFNPILQMFMYEAESRGHSVHFDNISMLFTNLRFKRDDSVIGYCYVDPIGNMSIKIYESTWKDMTPYEKEELLFHEIGHCLMGREHCSKLNKDGPVSIMHPRSLDTDYYKLNREELVDELFNISPECIGNDDDADEVDG